MNRTNLLCVVVSFVKHQTEQLLPHASVGVSLARLEEDALFLQRILVDLELAARNIQSMRSSEDKQAIDQTVFWAAHALGHCQFYDRVNQRLLRMGLRQAISWATNSTRNCGSVVGKVVMTMLTAMTSKPG